MDRKLKRRDFIRLSSVALFGAVAAACGAPPTAAPVATQAPAQPQATAVPPTKAPEQPTAVVVPPTAVPAQAEPPLLVDRVKAGKLPAIADRLPKNPLVVANREAIGVYGGEFRLVMFDPVWWVNCYDLIVERMLVYSDDDMRTIVPNVLESFGVTPDGKTWTLKLREGMKWSDGEKITTEDVRFWWEDHMAYKEINAAPWWQFRFGGENMKVDIVDDFTFKLTFAAPFGNFAAHMTRWTGNDAFLYPSHYLKQFHAKYVDKAKLETAAKAAKLETWVQYYNSKVVPGVWGGPDGVIDFPNFFPWRVVEKPKDGLYLWERNPFYWKVDTAGNQLPYVDTMRFDYAASTEVTKLKIAQSELDMVGMHTVTIAEYPFYKDNESKANFKIGDYISSMGDRVTLFPQHTLVEDPDLTKIVRDPRWVQALSVAIDREEINQSLFYGQAKMGALCPMPASKYYKESYGQAWAQFDKDLANKLLDEMGLKKGADGMRTRPDGKPLKYNIEHAGIRVGPVVPKFTEMVVSYWREVGIDATTKEIQESLYNTRMTNGQIHVGVWHADRCTDMLFTLSHNGSSPLLVVDRVVAMPSGVSGIWPLIAKMPSWLRHPMTSRNCWQPLIR